MKKNNGYLIVEVLIALLVFSIGILGALKMQANAISESVSHGNRLIAIELVNSLANKINLDSNSIDEYVNKSSQSYIDWQQELNTSLPNSLDKPPEIIVENIGGKNVLTIRVYWKDPSDNNFSQYFIKIGIV